MRAKHVYIVARVVVFSWLASVVLTAPMLLGWGVTDWRGFFANPARSALVTLTALSMVASFVCKEVYQIPVSGKGKRTHPDLPRVGLILLNKMVFLVVAAYSDRYGYLTMDGDALRMVGVAICIPSHVLMTWGPIHLGRQFSSYLAIQEDHRLVTDGPYRYWRHPRYAAMIYIVAGEALVFLSLPGLAFCLVACALFLWRIVDEEKLLADQFGEAYAAYCARTKKIIPFLL